MDSFEEATMNMAANAVLSRRQGSHHRKRVMGRYATVDNDVTASRQWPSAMMVDKSTQMDSRWKEEEAEYTKKKTILQGLLILVLLLHTTTSLRFLQAATPPPPFFSLITALTVLALACQVVAAGLLAAIAFMERSEKHGIDVIRKLNDVTVNLIIVVLLLCVFLSSLVPSHKKDSNVHIDDSNSRIVIE
ncbi:uncharacterized protein [Argopecten irradians]|uniref:uncharacterized protein n=1 Tax=Argopecten irradians TaxID=31199 RepID=UPI00372412E1